MQLQTTSPENHSGFQEVINDVISALQNDDIVALRELYLTIAEYYIHEPNAEQLLSAIHDRFELESPECNELIISVINDLQDGYSSSITQTLGDDSHISRAAALAEINKNSGMRTPVNVVRTRQKAKLRGRRDARNKRNGANRNNHFFY